MKTHPLILTIAITTFGGKACPKLHQHMLLGGVIGLITGVTGYGP